MIIQYINFTMMALLSDTVTLTLISIMGVKGEHYVERHSYIIFILQSIINNYRNYWNYNSYKTFDIYIYIYIY